MPYTPHTTLIVSGRRLTWDGDAPEARRDLKLTVRGSLSGAASLVVRFLYRGSVVAEAVPEWSLVMEEGESGPVPTGELEQTISLNTTELVTAFLGRARGVVLPLTVCTYDLATEMQEAAGTLPCINVVDDDLAPPTPAATLAYMTKQQYDRNKDGKIDPTALPDASVPQNWIALVGGEAIGGHRAVSVGTDGKAYYTDIEDADSVLAFIGISTGASEVDEDVAIQTSGKLEEPTWAWGPGPVFVGASAVLSQSIPETGAVIQVGSVLSETSIVVRIERPIFR